MAERGPRRVRLDTPLEPRRGMTRPHYDPDAFGRLSERIARFLGTAKFLVYMTVFIVVWVALNVTPYAFDRVALDEDRAQNQRLQADVEYLTREVASLRLALGEVATRDFLREQLREVTEEVVARARESGLGAEQAQHDHAATRSREERERRAERKKRRAAKHRAEEPVLPGLGEPFVGEDERD